jgi:hypothetical protein
MCVFANTSRAGLCCVSADERRSDGHKRQRGSKEEEDDDLGNDEEHDGHDELAAVQLIDEAIDSDDDTRTDISVVSESDVGGEV